MFIILKNTAVVGKFGQFFKNPFFQTMAWRSRGRDNADLVNQLELNGVIKTSIIKSAMLATDRKFYCPSDPYTDSPQSIGYTVTISAPHMHAFALELLADNLHSNCKVLDVGSGSGYLTACFARAITSKAGCNDALVVGIEHQPELVKKGIANISADDRTLIDSRRVLIIEGDGRLGYPEEAPYDVIHVGATSSEIPTAVRDLIRKLKASEMIFLKLLSQLKPGGRMVCPIGPENGDQYLEQFDKDIEGKIEQKRLFGVRYVPLTDLKRS